MSARARTRPWTIATLASLLAGGLGVFVWTGFFQPQAEGGGARTVLSEQDRRQRYREASAAFDKGNYAQARSLFAGLAPVYPALAERIGLKLSLARGEARRWLAAHPKSALVPDALAYLARTEPSALVELRERFEDHYRTREAIEKALVRSPDDAKLQAHLVRHFPESTLAYTMALRWEKRDASRLNAADWRALALAYRPGDSARAMGAYIRAGNAPENLLERARIHKRLKESAAARSLLTELLRRYPDSALAFDAAIELSTLIPAREALVALEEAERAFPARGDEALWKRILTLRERLEAPREAVALYRQLISRYPKSEKAPNAAWELAQWSAEQGDTAAARTHARWLLAGHPDDPFAPKAAFWLGKWEEQEGKSGSVQFRHVLKRYPTSYYAWRSAVRLGLADGSYDIDKQALPPVRWQRPPLPVVGAGATFAELLAMDALDEARDQWLSETYRRPITPPMKLAQAQLAARSGQNLVAINQSTLALLKAPPANPRSWEQAYPLPFTEPLRRWSAERKLNPLLVASLIRQESRFEPAIRSRSGAVGLMQLMPATARWISEKEPGEFALDNPEDNLRLGTWYLRYTHGRFGGSTVLALASYNAGPGNVSRWVQQGIPANEEDFIEKIPFRETRFYVVNIYENYWNYLRLYSTPAKAS